MEFSLNRYYGLNRRLLSVIGLWPYQNMTTAWMCRGLVMTIIIWTAIAQIIKICISEVTLDFVLDTLPILLPNVGVILQLLDRIINKDTMRELLDRIQADWKRTKSRDEIKIMHEYAANTRLITKLFSLDSHYNDAFGPVRSVMGRKAGASDRGRARPRLKGGRSHKRTQCTCEGKLRVFCFLRSLPSPAMKTR